MNQLHCHTQDALTLFEYPLYRKTKFIIRLVVHSLLHYYIFLPPDALRVFYQVIQADFWSYSGIYLRPLTGHLNLDPKHLSHLLRLLLTKRTRFRIYKRPDDVTIHNMQDADQDIELLRGLAKRMK